MHYYMYLTISQHNLDVISLRFIKFLGKAASWTILSCAYHVIISSILYLDKQYICFLQMINKHPLHNLKEMFDDFSRLISSMQPVYWKIFLLSTLSTGFQQIIRSITHEINSDFATPNSGIFSDCCVILESNAWTLFGFYGYVNNSRKYMKCNLTTLCRVYSRT